MRKQDKQCGRKSPFCSQRISQKMGLVSPCVKFHSCIQYSQSITSLFLRTCAISTSDKREALYYLFISTKILLNPNMVKGKNNQSLLGMGSSKKFHMMPFCVSNRTLNLDCLCLSFGCGKEENPFGKSCFLSP